MGTEQNTELRIIRLVRTQEDFDTVRYDDYDRVVVAVGNGNDAVRREGVDAMLTLLGQVNNYRISEGITRGKTFGTSKRSYVDVRRRTEAQTKHEPQVEITPNCEMRVTKAMTIAEIRGFCEEISHLPAQEYAQRVAALCAGMPAGVGEEEYLTRIMEKGDGVA